MTIASRFSRMTLTAECFCEDGNENVTKFQYDPLGWLVLRSSTAGACALAVLNYELQAPPPLGKA